MRVPPPMPSSLRLFDLPENTLEAAPPRPEHEALARRLPSGVALGGMSWSYPGWVGQVYGAGVSEKQLAKLGLTAYPKHPLLRTVEIDRSYYDPLASDAYRTYGEQVPDEFRFLAKAHEECVLPRFPPHARYGKKRGQPNARYLDADYAADAVVAPFVEGLGAKAAALVFQFPPGDAGEPNAFAESLHRFLRKLPRGVVYAVELRNNDLFTAAYAAALADSGCVHCHNVWSGMLPVLAQARLVPPAARRPLLVRWLFRQSDTYEAALARYAPFDHLADEDLENRGQVARLVAAAARHAVPAFVLVDNKAEGSAPESIARLATAIVEVVEQRANGRSRTADSA